MRVPRLDAMDRALEAEEEEESTMMVCTRQENGEMKQ